MVADDAVGWSLMRFYKVWKETSLKLWRVEVVRETKR